MSIEQIIKKKEECMISGFLEEDTFSLLAGFPFSFLSFFFISEETLIPFLQK